MREIGDFIFPETAEEAKEWVPIIRYRALASKVLCAATTRIEGTWAAYCDAVPGMKHSEEFQAVLDQGDKLMPAVAKSLFPEFSSLPYAY